MRPDPTSSVSPRSLDTQVGPLHLVLEMALRGDRFAHRVSASLEGGPVIVLAESLEDATESSWPSSPPLQQVDRCVLGNGREGLVAVGLAGVGHWSLAVEADERGVCWDAACRTPRTAEFLGSTYRLQEPAAWREVKGGLWRPLRDFAAGSTSQVSAEQGVLLGVDRGSVLWNADSGTLVIHAGELGSDPPATVRWKYRCTLHAASRP